MLTVGKDEIAWATDACLQVESVQPVCLLETLMADARCVPFGPVHHFLPGAVLLTCFANANDVCRETLAAQLTELGSRCVCVPGAACAQWGVCGAAASVGMAFAIAHENAPLKKEGWSEGQVVVAEILKAIAAAGSPRCCKRDSRIAVELSAKTFGLNGQTTKDYPLCASMSFNTACVGTQCRFFGAPDQQRAAKKRIKVAFICTKNSCRSHIAEAIARQKYPDMIQAYSAGTHAGPGIDPVAAEVLQTEYGIKAKSVQYSKSLDALPEVGAVITMGCGVECPALTASVHEDWGLEDPVGQSREAYIACAQRIEAKLDRLVCRLR